jgi:hypothetical protein
VCDAFSGTVCNNRRSAIMLLYARSLTQKTMRK